MSAGTLTLTNGSDIVAGSGTAFNTELAAGDFVVAIVGGITYTLPVKSVESPASLTLIRAFPGPTQSGAAWNAIPRATQNQLTAELVAQTTEALRGLNYDKQNWQAVFSASGDITVKMPDGSSFSGPSWMKIVELLNSIDPEAIQALADQIHTDALQVSADRSDVDSKASQVAGNASSAAAAAATATAAASTATTKAGEASSSAASAKTDADRAQSANPDNQLKKAENLADLPDKAVSRSNLSVYSTAEVNAKIGYALVDFGSMTTGQRKVMTNPFGNGTPVITRVEVLVGDEWADPGWLYNQSSSVGIGCRAGFTDLGVVVIAGSGGLKGSSTVLTGGIHASQSAAGSTASVRVHVWKLQP